MNVNEATVGVQPCQRASQTDIHAENHRFFVAATFLTAGVFFTAVLRVVTFAATGFLVTATNLLYCSLCYICYINSMIQYNFQCPQCGRPFTAARRDAKRCSSNCRVFAFRGIEPASAATNGATSAIGNAGTFVEVTDVEFLRMDMAAARDYLARKDAG